MEQISNEYALRDVFVQDHKPAYTLILALSAAILVGTGSGFSVVTTSSFNPQESGPVVTFVQPDKGTVEAAIVHHELLLHIRNSFKLNMTELAGILHVSRAALYAWFQGSTPRPDLQDLLWRLKTYADAAADKQIDRIDSLSKVPLSTGNSLIQALSVDRGVRAAIDEVALLAQTRAQSIEQMRSRSPRRRVQTIEQVTPAFDEFA